MSLTKIAKGCDISKHNGTINWDVVDTDEIQFVIIRAGFGFSTKDPMFETYIKGAIKRNIPIGIYWFSYAGNVEQAIREAKGCIDIIKPYKEYIKLPVFFDWEEESNVYVKRQYGITSTKATVSALTEAWCKPLEFEGFKTGIYSSKSYLENLFNDQIKKTHDIWVAHVADGNGNPLEVTTYKGDYALHQYSWVGKPKGFNANTDMNYCYKDYVNEKPVQSTPAQKQETVASPPSAKTINVSYLGYINGKGWSKEIKNEADFLGTDGRTLSGFTAQASEGKLKFRVHTRNGKWLGWIDKYNCSDWNWGVAGVKGKIIDGIQMDFSGVDGYTVMYRVSVLGTSGWYPWVSGYGNGINGYAGLLGKPIDKIQVKIVKK